MSMHGRDSPMDKTLPDVTDISSAKLQSNWGIYLKSWFIFLLWI